VKTDDQLDFSTYNVYYDKAMDPSSIARKLIGLISKVLRTNFEININDLHAYLRKSEIGFTPFQMYQAIEHMILAPLVVVNAYGIENFVKEDNDTLVLVPRIRDSSPYLDSFYARYPPVLVKKSLETVIGEITKEAKPADSEADGRAKRIRDMCEEEKDPAVQCRLLREMDNEIQSLFVEYAYVGYHARGLRTNALMEYLLEKCYSPYLYKVSGRVFHTVSHLALRVLEPDGSSWRDATKADKRGFDDYFNSFDIFGLDKLDKNGRPFFALVDKRIDNKNIAGIRCLTSISKEKFKEMFEYLSIPLEREIQRYASRELCGMLSAWLKRNNRYKM